MMHPKHLKIDAFTYPLPEEKIAKYPLPIRDASKMLIYSNGNITETIYRQLPEHLPVNSLLIFNNTKVIEARLLFKKSSGSSIEIFCLEPANEYEDITTAMQQQQTVQWKCLVGGAKKWKDEILVKEIHWQEERINLFAKIIEKTTNYFLVELSWNTELSFAEILHVAGLIPLPPYLHRDAEIDDAITYQTVYAINSGSVAAPTAGLHFTQELLNNLSAKAIKQLFVTLHVGAGTFKPVKAIEMKDHEMHAEFIHVSYTLVKALIEAIDEKIICVGTTSLRTIESLYWMGVKLNKKLTVTNNISIEDIAVHQWDPYEIKNNMSAKEALLCLLNWMKENTLHDIITKTQIIIAPGYQLKIVKGLITNFHQPKSTLLLLIAAIVGDDWKKVYNYALENDYRFLSYGDGCLLWY